MSNRCGVWWNTPWHLLQSQPVKIYLSLSLSLSCCSEPSVEDNRWLGEKKGAFKPPMLTSVKKSYVMYYVSNHKHINMLTTSQLLSCQVPV